MCYVASHPNSKVNSDADALEIRSSPVDHWPLAVSNKSFLSVWAFTTVTVKWYFKQLLLLVSMINKTTKTIGSSPINSSAICIASIMKLLLSPISFAFPHWTSSFYKWLYKVKVEEGIGSEVGHATRLVFNPLALKSILTGGGLEVDPLEVIFVSSSMMNNSIMWISGH